MNVGEKILVLLLSRVILLALQSPQLVNLTCNWDMVVHRNLTELSNDS